MDRGISCNLGGVLLQERMKQQLRSCAVGPEPGWPTVPPPAPQKSMNKKVVIFSVLIALAFGAVCALLWQQLRSTRQREQAAAVAARAEAELRATREDRFNEVERERERVGLQNKELAALTTTLRASEAQQASNVTALTRRIKAGLTNTAGGGEGDTAAEGGINLARMMKDPAMKEMMRVQQKAAMKTMYAPMFKELGISGDQQKKLTDLIIEAQMGSMENAGDLFGGNAESKTNAINTVVEQQKKMNEEIKSLLGPEKYAEYEDYQKSLGDRVVLNQFQQASAGTETALRDDQLKSMVRLMKEEREKVPPVISEDPTKTADSLSKLMNSEMMEQQFKWQEEFDKRVFERAGKVLTADQLKEFAEFQEQQSSMQKLGLKMAKEMFGGNKEGAPGDGKVAPNAK